MDIRYDRYERLGRSARPPTLRLARNGQARGGGNVQGEMGVGERPFELERSDHAGEAGHKADHLPWSEVVLGGAHGATFGLAVVLA